MACLSTVLNRDYERWIVITISAQNGTYTVLVDLILNRQIYASLYSIYSIDACVII